jgi:hypothetical protein
LNLKIFLADKSFHCLKQSVPSGSRSKAIVEKAAQLELSAATLYSAAMKSKRGICCYMPAITRA